MSNAPLAKAGAVVVPPVTERQPAPAFQYMPTTQSGMPHCYQCHNLTLEKSMSLIVVAQHCHLFILYIYTQTMHSSLTYIISESASYILIHIMLLFALQVLCC